MNHPVRRVLIIAASAPIALLAACGGDDEANEPGAAPTVATTASAPPPPSSASETTAPATTAAGPATTVADDPGAPVDSVEAWCQAQVSALFGTPFPGPSKSQIFGYAAGWRPVLSIPFVGADGAAEPRTEVGSIDDAGAAATATLDEMEMLATDGDLEGAVAAADRVDDLVIHRMAAVAVTGTDCGVFGAGHAEGSSIEVPLLAGWQIGTGFGSVWVAREATTVIERLDPATGDVVATIDVGALAFKMQPADGRMWVRTPDAYVAIDPATNAVDVTLAKVDVGPDANRSWAVDGAMWICDGTRLHRYDPTTLAPVALIDLDIACDQVVATEELAVAFTYNEDDGESGTSAAVLVDPATNAVLHTVSLPMDALTPVVLDGVVYVPGNGNDDAATIDRATGAVSAAPSLGRAVRGSQAVSGGEVIFVPAKDSDEIVVVDATTFEVRDTWWTLGLNSLDVLDGRLWTANNVGGFTQAFDL